MQIHAKIQKYFAVLNAYKNNLLQNFVKIHIHFDISFA